MTLRDDVRTLRDFLQRQGSTEAAWKALDRIEETIPKPRTLKDQFEAYPIGTRFELEGADMQFVKVGPLAMVRVFTTWEGKTATQYHENLFTKNVYEHWAWDSNGTLRKLT